MKPLQPHSGVPSTRGEASSPSDQGLQQPRPRDRAPSAHGHPHGGATLLPRAAVTDTDPTETRATDTTSTSSRDTCPVALSETGRAGNTVVPEKRGRFLGIASAGAPSQQRPRQTGWAREQSAGAGAVRVCGLCHPS